MLIAIPSDSPGGLDARISDHFGHCDAFTLVQVDNGAMGDVKVVANSEHQEGGCMAPVMALKRLSVDALVAGGMGMRPLAGFHSVGIAVHWKGAAQTARDAVQLFLEGKCPELGREQTCGGGSGQCGGHHEQPRPAIEGKAQVQRGRVVTLDFVLKNAAGEIVDSSSESGPMRYLQGSGVIKKLEQGIEGLEAGGCVTVELSPSECFGEREESRIIQVPRERLPADLEVGDSVTASGPHGQIQLIVLELDSKMARLDGNHPLAGQNIVFDFTVAKVEAALPEELAGLPPVA